MEHPCTGLTQTFAKYVIGITVFLVFSLNMALAASPNVTPLDMTSYVAQGYSVDGPFEVASAAPNRLVLASAPEDIVLSPGQQNMLIKDQYSTAVSVDGLVAGKWVYVLRKGNQVVVFLIPSPQSNKSDH